MACAIVRSHKSLIIKDLRAGGRAAVSPWYSSTYAPAALAPSVPTRDPPTRFPNRAGSWTGRTGRLCT